MDTRNLPQRFKKGSTPWNKGKKFPQFSGENSPMWKGGQVKKNCDICGSSFFVDFYRKKIARFCSRKCKGKSIGNREKSLNWKGGKIEHSCGYYLIKVDNHPFSNKAGYIPEHRLIAEKTIGRYINPKKEHVHHIDENKKNNDPNNLLVLTFVEHRRIHDGWKFIDNEWWKPCGRCKKFLMEKGNFYMRDGGTKSISYCNPCNAIIKKGNDRRRREYAKTFTKTHL
ncbi:MAG TPA: HNH endonuclease [Gammaproteobacteria bacterium]|nr:HNH endonuclease [Gammaproteobacteria bacterium]